MWWILVAVWMIDPCDKLQHSALHRNDDERLLPGPPPLDGVAAGIGFELADPITIKPVEPLSAMTRPQLTPRIGDRHRQMQRRQDACRDGGRPRPAAVSNSAHVVGPLEKEPECEHPKGDRDGRRLAGHAEHRCHDEPD